MNLSQLVHCTMRKKRTARVGSPLTSKMEDKTICYHAGPGCKHVHSQEKSAHTALAVKACLLGGNSNTKCSMTFVNIAVAISALAGGGGQKRFRTKTKFRTETKFRNVSTDYPVIYSGFCSLCSKTSFFTGFRALRRRRIAPWRC